MPDDLVRAQTPLYQGVVLLRDMVLGVPGPVLLWRVAYLPRR